MRICISLEPPLQKRYRHVFEWLQIFHNPLIKTSIYREEMDFQVFELIPPNEEDLDFDDLHCVIEAQKGIQSLKILFYKRMLFV